MTGEGKHEELSCEGSGNATPPSPGVAPGGESIDPAAAARDAAARGVDPRLRKAVPSWDAPFFQAGLAGYSDAAMRLIARRHGCPLCVTEALLDRTLLAGGRGFAKADLGELHDNVPGGPEDTPLVGQIMGSDEQEMAAAAVKMIEQRRRTDREYRHLAYGDTPPAASPLRLPGGEQLASMSSHAEPTAEAPMSFAAIDVNLACPVKKIDRKARGGHWLMHPQGALEILKAVRRAVPPEVPCSVKLRRAYDDTPEMARNFNVLLKGAADLGYAWATVHGRTVAQKYVGPSRWDILRGIVDEHGASIPVLGSGDIWNAAEVFRMLAYCGVAAVSVARGCIGNPWIFRQAREMLAGRPPRPPTLAEQRAVLLEHFDLALAVNAGRRHAPEQTAKVMRKFAVRFAAHHPRGEEVRVRMVRVASPSQWREIVDEFYPALS